MNPLNFYKYLPFVLRKKAKHKYIVIESDDWGLERALSERSLSLIEKKYGKENFSRWTTDSLETPRDLNDLFALLEKYRRRFDSGVIITANFITHNFDYKNRDELTFIPLTRGFNPGSEDVRDCYLFGIKNGYIFPQLHGYSHYNLTSVKEHFKTADGEEDLANGFFAAKSTIKGMRSVWRDELGAGNDEIPSSLKDSVSVFKELFGFAPKSLIPPGFIIDPSSVKHLKTNGIKIIQASNRLVSSNGRRFYIPFFRKCFGLIWSVRNARLDPHPEYKFYADQCLNSIKTAFENKMPAIIDFHRVNFSGRFNPEYKSRTLFELDYLLDNIHKNWPDARFVHTERLFEIWQSEPI